MKPVKFQLLDKLVQYNYPTPIAQAAVRSYIVDSLFIVASVVCVFVFGPCFVMQSILLLQSSR